MAKEKGDSSASQDAAFDEATNAEEPVTVEFRGAQFEIDRPVLASARFLIAVAKRDDAQILVEMLAPTDHDRFLALVRRGEGMSVVANEFLTAANTAMKLGDKRPNSPTSPDS